MSSYLKFSGIASLPGFISTSTALAISLLIACGEKAEARSHHTTSSTSSHSSSHTHHSAAASTSRHGHGPASRHGHSAHVVAASSGRHGRHHHEVAHAAPKTRYAYALGLFMRSAPSFDSSPLSEENADAIARAFERGTADSYPARSLVRAGLVKYHPLHGGIFWRREPIKYIVMHSTETGNPISAPRVIESWNSMGMRHPGAQYVVDRDGTIYQAVDPDLATVHVNIFKTLPGINNDNSIGIEMNHTGSQDYPQAERQAVIKLVGYLKHRYNIDEGNIITHRYAQQGDHTDPVNFDWDGFLAQVNTFHNQAIAYRSTRIKDDAKHWQKEPEAKTNTYLKPHHELGGAPSVVPPDKTPSELSPTPTELTPTEKLPPEKLQEKSTPVPEKNMSEPTPVDTPDTNQNSNMGSDDGYGNFKSQKSSPMPESPVPEPSEADQAVNHSQRVPGPPVQMKLYPNSGQAPQPGSLEPSPPPQE